MIIIIWYLISLISLLYRLLLFWNHFTVQSLPLHRFAVTQPKIRSPFGKGLNACDFMGDTVISRNIPMIFPFEYHCWWWNPHVWCLKQHFWCCDHHFWCLSPHLWWLNHVKPWNHHFLMVETTIFDGHTRHFWAQPLPSRRAVGGQPGPAVRPPLQEPGGHRWPFQAARWRSVPVE